MGYKYEVFISYRRHGQWPQWVKEQFLPLFDHWLGEELGTDYAIYIDQNMKEGLSWPDELAYALSHSKVLVPLWSRQYFYSKWCQAELAHMLARQKECKLGTNKNRQCLIVPAIIHDGQDRPKFISDISCLEIQDCTSIRMAKGSPKGEELEDRIKKWVPSIARAIESAPKHNPEWLDLTADEFLRLFNSTAPRQTQLPGF